MRQLFLLFLRNGGLLTFLLLEVISIYLVVQFNPQQEKIFFNSLNNGVAKFDSGSQGIIDYFQLNEYADSLARANAQMIEKLDNAKFIHLIESDSIKNKDWEQQYIVTAAEIMDKTVSRKNNYFLLNRGLRHGIKKNSGVISENGVLGVVIDVSNDFSQVMTVLHQQAKISAAIKRTDDFGSLIWGNSDSRFMYLNDIPKHVRPILGDTIHTSGFSQIFPKGIMVGTIEEFDLKNGSNFYEIKVKLSNDLRTVKFAYIIDNLKRTQIETLNENIKDNE